MPRHKKALSLGEPVRLRGVVTRPNIPPPEGFTYVQFEGLEPGFFRTDALYPLSPPRKSLAEFFKCWDAWKDSELSNPAAWEAVECEVKRLRGRKK